MTITDRQSRISPGTVGRGCSRCQSVSPLSISTYTARATNDQPMMRWLMRSTRARRTGSTSERSLHCPAPLAVTSITLSKPKLTSATLPARKPEINATTASRQLYAIVA